MAETEGIHWNEHQPASGGGHTSFYQLKSGGKMGGQQEDEKEK
jgi:hypothetical protein